MQITVCCHNSYAGSSVRIKSATYGSEDQYFGNYGYVDGKQV